MGLPGGATGRALSAGGQTQAGLPQQPLTTPGETEKVLRRREGRCRSYSATAGSPALATVPATPLVSAARHLESRWE